MAGDLVHALAPFRVRVGREADADPLVGGCARLPAVLAQVVPAGRDAEVQVLTVAQDGVQAETAGARLPLARVLVVGDAGDHLPRIAAVPAAEERRGLDAGEQIGVPIRLERPYVGERAPVFLGERRRRLRLR